jgi:dTDP-4-amino-4,6-dideoxygalactose transaminase
MAVPLLDLKAQFAPVRDEVLAAVARVFETQQYVLGPFNAELERRVAEYVGAPHALAVSSGTDAILVALMALGVGPGDEVVTTPYTFFATAGSIARLGARPVFVDIDRASFNVSPEGVRRALTPRTKAVLPVHLFGRMADVGALLDAAGGVPVVEDAAQAIGARTDGMRAGSAGAMGCFSFYPTKNLSGAGDGGLVTARDGDLAGKVRILRNHGMEPRYYHGVIGGNFRLDEIQCAVLCAKLGRLEQWTERRRANARRYRGMFEAAGLSPGAVELPAEPGGASRHVYHQFVVRVAADARDGLRARLAQRKIGHDVYYPVPLHLQECFRYLGHGEGDFPESEAAARETIAVPIYPELSDSQAEEVVSAFRSFFGSH